MAGRARTAIGSILFLIGLGLLIFAMLWYFLGIRRLAVFPSGFDHTLECEGTVTKLTGKHGLLALSPPQKEPVSFSQRFSSLDADYRANVAEVEEVVKSEGVVPFGLELDSRNVYVMSRRDCENLESNQSSSGGVVVDRTGSWYVNFPIGTKKESRNVFNNDVASAFAVNYVKTGKVNGVGVYVFRGSMDHRPVVDYRAKAMGLPTTTTFGDLKRELAERGLPLDNMIRAAYRSLTPEERSTFAGFPDSRPIELRYTEKTEWAAEVEPVTGTIVKVDRCLKRLYVNTDVATFLPLFEILANHSEDAIVSRYLSQVDQQKLLEPKEIYRIEYSWTGGAVKEMTDFAGKRVSPMRFIKDYMMTTMLLIGAAFFVVGLAVRRKEHRREQGNDDHPPPRLKREPPEGGDDT